MTSPVSAIQFGSIELTLDGAEAARDLIDECFQQALMALERSIKEKNRERIEFWKERIVHFMNELNEIDRVIIELKRLSGAI